MAGDFNKPVTTDAYASVLTEIRDQFADQGKLFDGTSTTNYPVGSKRLIWSTGKFEQYNGTTWDTLALNGMSIGATTPSTGAFTTLSATANSASPALKVTQSGAGDAFVVEDATGDTTPFVIDANGRVLRGHTTAVTYGLSGYTANQHFGQQISGLGGSGNEGIAIGNFGTVASPSNTPQISFNRSKSGVIGTHAVVTTSDRLGGIGFFGSDGTSFVEGASIYTVPETGVGAGSMPTSIYFATTPNGADLATVKMAINSAGNVVVGSGTVAANVGFYSRKNITGGVTSYGVLQQATVMSDVTANAYGFTSIPTTEAANFTLGGYGAVSTSNISVGAGSIVSNQYGAIANSLISATNNYGFYANTTATVDNNTAVAATISTVAVTANVVTIVTTAAHGYTTGMLVTVAAGTNTQLNGSGLTITVVNTTTFTYARTTADVATVADTGTITPSKRWNFYAVGTAPNYFAGRTQLQGAVHNGITRSTVASGSTITLTTASNHLLYDNAATAAALTINLPTADLVDGQTITVATRSAITTLTMGGTIYGAPATLAAGGFATFIYSTAGAAWFRKG